MNQDPRVHIHLRVADLEASRAFYERFLGVAPTKRTADYAKFLPAFAPLNLALSPRGPAEGAAVRPPTHFGLQLGSREAVAAERDRLRAGGLALADEPAVDCCYANQDKFWVRDPDGVRWEVYHLNYDLPLPAGEQAGDAAPGARCPTGCC